MRISEMRELLEGTAIDHSYYRSYDPMVRCVGREYTPLRAAQIAMLVAGGRLTWTPDVVEAMYWSFNTKIDQVWNFDSASEIFNIDEGDWDRPARADLVDAGAAPEFVKAIEANVKKSGNVYGTKDSKAAVGKAGVLYVVDDTTRAQAPEIAVAMKKILKAKGVAFATLEKGTDGWGLYDLGLWGLAEEKAKEFAGFIKASGAKTVVANCPAVVYALREWYPTIGIKLNAKVLHHTEYLEQLGVTGKLKGKVTFHDPAYLGRLPWGLRGAAEGPGEGLRPRAGGVLLHPRQVEPDRPLARLLQPGVGGHGGCSSCLGACARCVHRGDGCPLLEAQLGRVARSRDQGPGHRGGAGWLS